MKAYDMVIIGGGVAGRMSTKLIAQLNPGLKIAVIRDQKVMVNPCSIPYALGGELTIDEILEPDKKVTRWNAELIVDKAISIDPESKVVHTENGNDYKYNKLLITPGAVPIKPPIPGVELENVHVLRNSFDVYAVENALKNSKKVVIVGGGYIGAELGVLHAVELPQDARAATSDLRDDVPHVAFSLAVPDDLDDSVFFGVPARAIEHPRDVGGAVGRVEVLVETEFSIVSAGTTDIPVAEEAACTAEVMGNEVLRIIYIKNTGDSTHGILS